MSVLRVNQITNFNDNGPVEFTNGLTIPSGQSIDGTLLANVGYCTATSFFGDGSQLTLPNGISKSLAISIPYVVLF
jgi:hypothetical protein